MHAMGNHSSDTSCTFLGLCCELTMFDFRLDIYQERCFPTYRLCYMFNNDAPANSHNRQ